MPWAQVLEQLLAENDTVPEVLLLLTQAYGAGGELREALAAARQGQELAKVRTREGSTGGACAGAL